MIFSVQAKAVMEITFKKDGKTIVIPKHSIFTVDLEKNIALFNGYHFDVEPSEFVLLKDFN